MSKQESITVELPSPITIGDKEHSEIQLRSPTAGDLRGVSLAQLIIMDVDAVAKVLPRIAQPVITEQHALSMDAETFTVLATEVSGFLTGNAS